MTLQAAIEQYVAWRQARGTRFQSGASVLRLYGRSVGSDVECDAVRPDQTSTFLAGADSLAAARGRTEGTRVRLILVAEIIRTLMNGMPR